MTKQHWRKAKLLSAICLPLVLLAGAGEHVAWVGHKLETGYAPGALYMPDGRKAVFVSSERLQMWDLGQRKRLWQQKVRGGELSVSRDGTKLVTVNSKGAQIWEAKSGRKLRRVSVTIPRAWRVQKVPRTQIVFREVKHVGVSFGPHDASIAIVSLFDQRHSSSGFQRLGNRGQLSVYDARSGRVRSRHLLLAPKRQLQYTVTFSPDGKTVAILTRPLKSAERRKSVANKKQKASMVEVWLWDRGGRLRHRLPAFEEGDLIVNLAFSPDGQRLAALGRSLDGVDFTGDQEAASKRPTARQAGAIRIWQVSNGRLLRSLHPPSGVLAGPMVFLPGKDTLVSGGADRTLVGIGVPRLHHWDVVRGKLLSVHELKTKAEYIQDIAPDGNSALTHPSFGSLNNGRVMLWQKP